VNIYSPRKLKLNHFSKLFCRHIASFRDRNETS